MWFFHNPGLLGINARNLLYIKPYNPKKAILLADDKIKTKNFLSARGIPVAKLYTTVSSKKELADFDFSALPPSFALKPNSGYGGEGILIISKHTEKGFVKEDGQLMSQDELSGHVSDILDGRYSLADISDVALFEQRLVAPEFLRKMSYQGLPDVRIVVHNLIPVMAMLRLSSEVSQGKANIHMGGIAVGIDMAKGELTHVTQHGKRISGIPGYGSVKGVKLPKWEEMLLIASRVQHITNLGFAAVDLAIDKNMGPALLEINARAGLSVQIANMAPLRRRLQRIEGIKVTTPEKGVRIAQDIFGQKLESKQGQWVGRAVVGSLEKVEILGKKENQRVMAYIDPHAERSSLDSQLAEELGIEEDGRIKFNLGEKRISTVVQRCRMYDPTYQMIIGRRDLGEFLIDATRRPAVASDVPLWRTPKLIRTFGKKELQEIDQEICDIDKQIRLLSHLRPLNLKEEQMRFAADPSYCPQFAYPPLKFDLQHIYTRLNALEMPDSPMGILWQKKADEIYRKLALLGARGSSAFTDYAIALYGQVDEITLQEALSQPPPISVYESDIQAIFTDKEAKKQYEQAIQEYGLTGWRVKIEEGIVSKVVANKENVVFIRAGSVFKEDYLKSTIAHELETHAFTAMNGAAQPYQLFQRGLADYLMTEEGLAVYNQRGADSGNALKKYWPAYSSIIGIHTAMHGSFAEVVAKVQEKGFSAEKAWRVALKAKRGLADTRLPGAFTKDLVYFKGYKMVCDFVEKGGDLKDLYYGKMNLDDLEIVKKVKGLIPPRYLPGYLKG